ncbi:MAG: DUF4974 domain-containing protein [Cytophagales bacterium]|nr:DUF4974 domain-containing protein [Cytophagales bacterium]
MKKILNVEELIENQSFREVIFNEDTLSEDDWAILATRFEVDIEDVKSAQLFLMSLNRPTTDFETVDQGMLLSRINATIDNISKEHETIIPIHENKYGRKRVPYFKSRWIGIAATLIIIVSSLFVVKSFVEPTIENQVVFSMVEKTTSKGQKLKIFLPDGSTAMLNSGSKIQYPEQFDSGSRKVTVEGEVFFDVKSDSLKPFIVSAQGVIATVLGTSFNIKNSDDEVVSISLVSGRLAVEKQGQNKVSLSPGEMAVVNSFDPIEVQEFVSEDVISWKDGVIVFKNATFEELIKKLENWYGVSISVRGQVDKDFHYTGKYDNYTLDEILEGISFLKKFDYEINENRVVIVVR